MALSACFLELMLRKVFGGGKKKKGIWSDIFTEKVALEAGSSLIIDVIGKGMVFKTCFLQPLCFID